MSSKRAGRGFLLSITVEKAESLLVSQIQTFDYHTVWFTLQLILARIDKGITWMPPTRVFFNVMLGGVNLKLMILQ